MVFGLVFFRGFEEFDRLHVEALRETDLEGSHRHCGMVRRCDLLDPIIYLSSEPVGACQLSRRAAAEESHHNTDANNQREVKCAVFAKAGGTTLHHIDGSTNYLVRKALRYSRQFSASFEQGMLDFALPSGGGVPALGAFMDSNLNPQQNERRADSCRLLHLSTSPNPTPS